ncbi:MAG: hypothetical protein WA476_21400 [Acidobacteriaceae bacterium]
MNPAAVAGVLAGILMAPWQAAPPNPPPSQAQPQNTEHIESGEVRVTSGANGNPIFYRIRLLPLTSFPDLPAPVVAELTRRQCLIPQSFEAQQPENVIHGAFRAAGSRDWAALCSTAGTTTLYVFFAGEAASPVALRSQPDSAWLGAEPGSADFGSSWGIAVRSAAELRATPRLRRAAAIDHDAIDDARLERSVTIHYFQAGNWLELNHSDGSD